MNELNRVFLPLRSNIGWFQSLDLQREISNRVKESILLFDELYIEDGTFSADIVQDVGPTKWYLPPGSTPFERRTIEFERDLKPTSIKVGIGPDGSTSPTAIVLQGNASIRYKIDYYDIFKDIEINDYNFLKFIVLQNEYNIPRNARDIIQSQSRKDKSNFIDLHPNKEVRDLVIDNLNHDLVASVLLKSSIIIDSAHHSLLRRKCWRKDESISSKPVIDSIALREILNIEVPDISRVSIKEILQLREEASWNSFREFIRSISLAVKEDPEIMISPKLSEKILRYYATELSNKLEKKHESGLKLAIELGIGAISLIPVFGEVLAALSAAKSVKSYWDDNSTWFAFVSKLKKV